MIWPSNGKTAQIQHSGNQRKPVNTFTPDTTLTQQTARYLIQRLILIQSYVIGKVLSETHPSPTRHLLAVFAPIFILASNILRDSHRLGMSSIPLPNAEPMRGKRQTDPILQRHPSPILQPQANTQQ